jgi:hypothetical protein
MNNKIRIVEDDPDLRWAPTIPLANLAARFAHGHGLVPVLP